MFFVGFVMIHFSKLLEELAQHVEVLLTMREINIGRFSDSTSVKNLFAEIVVQNLTNEALYMDSVAVMSSANVVFQQFVLDASLVLRISIPADPCDCSLLSHNREMISMGFDEIFSTKFRPNFQKFLLNFVLTNAIFFFLLIS